MESVMRPGRASSMGREAALELRRTTTSPCLFVDTLEGAPDDMARFRVWNPFFNGHEPCIPVPGQSLKATSVESIWQGLKIIDGRMDLAMLERKATKRPSEAQRRLDPSFNYSDMRLGYGGRVLDLWEARFLVYLPAYLFVVALLTPRQLFEEVRHTLESGASVVFYDWDDNQNISDCTSSFSHSALLAAWFNNELDSELLSAARLRLAPPDLEILETALVPILNCYKLYHSKRN